MKQCCDNPNLEYCPKVDVDLMICTNCCAIDEDATQDNITERAFNEGRYGNYSDHWQIKKYMGYKVRHHVSEVLKRIECSEPNKPTDLEAIKSSLDGDYSLANIWKKCNRKHMIYIFCEINRLPKPDLSECFQRHIKQCLVNMAQGSKKLPNYIYIIKRICKKEGRENLMQYLYVKTQNKKLDDLIDQYI